MIEEMSVIMRKRPIFRNLTWIYIIATGWFVLYAVTGPFLWIYDKIDSLYDPWVLAEYEVVFISGDPFVRYKVTARRDFVGRRMSKPVGNSSIAYLIASTPIAYKKGIHAGLYTWEAFFRPGAIIPVEPFKVCASFAMRAPGTNIAQQTDEFCSEVVKR